MKKDAVYTPEIFSEILVVTVVIGNEHTITFLLAIVQTPDKGQARTYCQVSSHAMLDRSNFL